MLTIDAYQWVMVPNIFGMSQYADGGLLMTRPYFSSSNYILKMSGGSYKKGSWCDIWDALYYRFIYKNHDMLKKIYATARNVAHWDKKSKEEQNELLETAELYLKFLDSNK
jgi:deoxyribodipyrimidine photolyase-related protein